MIKTLMKRFCVICGKELDIILGEPIEEGLEIVSGGYYYNNFGTRKNNSNPKSIDEQTEYRECEECYND